MKNKVLRFPGCPCRTHAGSLENVKKFPGGHSLSAGDLCRAALLPPPSCVARHLTAKFKNLFKIGIRFREGSRLSEARSKGKNKPQRGSLI